MKFNETPLFITDEHGNRVKVIMNIDDFYTLLAQVDAQSEYGEQAQRVEEHKQQEIAPAQAILVSSSGQLVMATANASGEHIAELRSDSADQAVEQDEPVSTPKRMSNEELFDKAFAQLKKRNKI